MLNEELLEENDILYLAPTTIATSNTTVTATTVTKTTVSSPNIDAPEVIVSLGTRTTEVVHEQMDTSLSAQGIFCS